MSSTARSTDRSYRSAFGFLRLLFASLVIVSHAPEMVDGNRSREPLTELFGTISFGDVAVDGFFLISGYLIVGSYLNRANVVAYLRKRVARIYPGFLVATAISFLIVAPLGGGSLSWIAHNLDAILLRALLLQAPAAPGVFPGQSHPDIDGAMWTIAYEFRCYLLVVILGSLGFFRRAWPAAILASIALTAFEVIPAQTFRHIEDTVFLWPIWFGDTDQTLRFTGIFLMGVFAFLIRERIRYTHAGLAVAAVLVIASMFVRSLAEPAIATCGAYIIFATARWGGNNWLQQVNNRTDISYGVYLYAWPTTQLLIRYCPSWPPAVQGVVTLFAASVCGWLSWKYVERPVIAYASRCSAKGEMPIERVSEPAAVFEPAA